MKKYIIIGAITLIVLCSIFIINAVFGEPRDLKSIRTRYQNILSQGTEYICDIPFIINNNGECGYISVPIDYTDSSKGHHNVFWYKFTPDVPKSQNVLIPLVGGPGAASSYDIFDYLFTTEWSAIRESFTILGFDYRATGFSAPYNTKVRKSCGYYHTMNDMSDCANEIKKHQSLFQGISSKNIALDIKQIMNAHNISQAILFGTSFGTRIALTALREIPEAIQGVILDGTLPIEVNTFTQSHEGLIDNLEYIMELASSNRFSPKDAQHTITTFNKIAEMLKEYPIEDSLSVLSDIAEMAYYYNLPWLMDRYYEQVRYGTLNATNDLTNILQVSDPAYSIYNLELFDDESVDLLLFRSQSPIATAAILLAEEYAFIEEQMPRESTTILDSEIYSIINEYYYGPLSLEEAEDWSFWLSSLEVHPVEMNAIHSDVPVLLFGGMRDIITPIRWAKQTVDNLSNSKLFIFYQYGHEVSMRAECSNDLILPFIMYPTIETLHSLSLEMCYDEIYTKDPK